MRRAGRSSVAIAVICAVVCARCHDWDSLTRDRPTDGGTPRDASTTGNFACRPPYALAGFWGGDYAPQVLRFEFGESPSSCETLPIPGFAAGEPVRAVVVDGDRVLVVGDTRACILTVTATSVSDQCADYPFSVGTAQPVDAFVRINPARRFAASFAIGTAGTITHLLVEDDRQTLSQQLTINNAGLSAITGGALVRSIQTSHEGTQRVFALRDDREEVVSAEQDNSGRTSLLAASDPPGLYTALGVGPSSALGPTAAMILRSNESQFAMVLNRTKFPSNECSQCSRLAHVIPISADPRRQLVACADSSGHPAFFVHEVGSTCIAGPALPSGTHVGRMAIRWQ